MNQPLTRRAFTAWLRSLPPDAVAGQTCSDLLCPLARYLRECGAAYASVGSHVYRRAPGRARGAALPAWATAFILAVDAGGARSITAGAALVALEGRRC